MPLMHVLTNLRSRSSNWKLSILQRITRSCLSKSVWRISKSRLRRLKLLSVTRLKSKSQGGTVVMYLWMPLLTPLGSVIASTRQIWKQRRTSARMQSWSKTSLKRRSNMRNLSRNSTPLRLNWRNSLANLKTCKSKAFWLIFPFIIPLFYVYFFENIRAPLSTACPTMMSREMKWAIFLNILICVKLVYIDIMSTIFTLRCLHLCLQEQWS